MLLHQRPGGGDGGGKEEGKKEKQKAFQKSMGNRIKDVGVVVAESKKQRVLELKKARDATSGVGSQNPYTPPVFHFSSDNICTTATSKLLNTVSP